MANPKLHISTYHMMGSPNDPSLNIRKQTNPTPARATKKRLTLIEQVFPLFKQCNLTYALNIIIMGGVKGKVAKIPLGDTPEDQKARLAIFKEFDVNCNAYLSLAEIDKGIRDVLNLPELFEAKPVIMRAYKAACAKVKEPKPNTEDLVTKGVFKYLLIYLRFYYELWEDFDRIDVDNERRISEKEFVKGAPILINEWHLQIPNPQETFKKMLEKYNAQAHITFTDFCDYVIGERLKKHKDHEKHNSF